ncbi:cardiac-enriched FHL2-interacting protein isoform 1-T2 [Spinachia spinachia]
MTSAELRRSGRRSAGHRKHSDGGYSDTSSVGSYLDETDREVSNLTDRAFRSLCIGDEAVYNDSDLCSSSPCNQRDRQLAFCQRGQDRDGDYNEREELDRTVHESFSLKMQQYGQDQIRGRIYEAEIQRDPRWEINGERRQGRVSATFRRSFVETSQQEEYLVEEQPSFHSNGATTLSTQQRRSRSRVSSLIRAFNSEGHRDGAGMDGKLREWNDETGWDKSALMSIRTELSEFSTSYQQNSGNFPSAGPFSSHDNNFHPSEVGATPHVYSASSFISSSHSRHSMTEQHGQSNVFIHSEFSPFKVWRHQSRFPFQQAAVSGFMHSSEFPKWFETPMYRELSLEAQPQGPYRFEERGIRPPRNTMAPAAPPTLPRPTSTSTLLQKASAVEKRCESELTGHYPHKMWMQSPGTKRFPSQRPSTASPSSEMSRRVQDTISSVKALQQKIKKMTEQNTATGITENEQGGLCSNAPNANTSTAPFSISHLLTPLVRAHDEAEKTEVRHSAVSPQPVEHPPVRAESRGATPDVRVSCYKSRATGLLFNLKDNRKRVKSTYSPVTFKGSETLEKNKHCSTQESRDTVIDIPDFADPNVLANADSHQYVNQYNIPGFTRQHSQTALTGLNPEYTSRDYQRGGVPSDVVNPPEFTGFLPKNNSTYHQPASGKILHEGLWSFNPLKQDNSDNLETLGGDVHRFEPSYIATEIPRLNADNNQPGEYLISKANAEQHVNETVGREFTKVDRYEQLKENKHDYSNVSSEGRWRQTNSQDTENLRLKAISPWKQELTSFTGKKQHADAYQRADVMKEKANSLNKKYRGENQIKDSFAYGTNSYKKAELVNTSNQLPQNAPFSYDTVERSAFNGQQQQGTLKDKSPLQRYNGHIHENEFRDNDFTQKYTRHTDQQSRNQGTLYSSEDKSMQETHHRKQHTPIPKICEQQSQQPTEQTPQHEPTLANQVKVRQFVEVRTEPAVTEHIKAQHAHAELAKAQHGAPVDQQTAESAGLILAEPTGLEKVKADQAKAEATEQQFKEEKGGQEQCREKQPYCTRKEQTETHQIVVRKVTEGLTNITEEVGAEHVREEHDVQVTAIQAEAKRLKKEHVKTELAKTEQAGRERLEEEVKLEQIQKQRVETGQKTKVVEVQKVKDNNILVEVVKQESGEEEAVEASQFNADQLTTQIDKAKGRKTDQSTLEPTKAELVKAAATKDLQEKLSKTAAKETKVAEQIKSEPDKVKTELAEIKAGEQKEKTDLLLRSCINRNEENKDQAQATQIQQQREDTVVRGQYLDQANKGSDEYERLREKYGFIDTDSASKNKASATENVSSNDATSAASLDRVETTNNKKSKGSSSPRSEAETANTGKKEEVGCLKPTEFTESSYVTHSHSDPSKECSLSGGNSLPKNLDKMNVRVEKLEKCDPLKQSDVSQHRDSGSAQLLPLERNLKSTEHSAGPGKDQHFPPPRALSTKERAQTKQEILTSKIKAHAEKEISAIKEKGFAVRDGFSFKNSTKQLIGGQSYNVRQMPPSQEGPKKHEGTIPSSTTTKHPMEPSGLQIETIKPVLPPSSATSPVRSAAATRQLVGQLLKHGPQEPVKTNYDAQKPLGEEEKMRGLTFSTNEDLGGNQKKKNPYEIKSTIQEQAPKNLQCNMEENQGETSGKPIGEQKRIPATNADDVNKEKEGPSQALALVKADDSESITTEKAVREAEAVHEDSAPLINHVFGQKGIPVADDSLQIMGIMVTVRDREPATDNSPTKSRTPEQMIVNECSNSGMDRFRPGSGLEGGGGNTSSEDVCTVNNTPSTVKEEQTRVDVNARLENVQEYPTLETRPNNMSENISGERPNHQLELKINDVINAINDQPQLHERLDEQPVASSVVRATENEVAEIQPQLYTQDIMKSPTKYETKEISKENSEESILRDEEKSNTEERNPQKKKTTHTNEIGADAATLIKHNVQPLVKEDMTTVTNASKSRNIDGERALPVEEKACYSITPKPFNKISQSHSLTDKANKQVFPKDQNKQTHTGGTDQMDDNVHIGSIAVRVAPAVTEKDTTHLAGNPHVTAAPSDLVANEQNQVGSFIHEEKWISFKNEDRIKDLISESSDKQIENSLEDPPGVQCVLSGVKKLCDSLKMSHQENNPDANSEITQIEIAKPEKLNESATSVDESTIQLMLADYFQVQRAAGTSNEPHNSANVGDSSEAVSKEKGLPRIPPNQAAISSESCSEGKDSILDQNRRNKVESSSERRNRETEGNTFSKQSSGPSERWSYKNEKTDAGQASPMVKHHADIRSSLSAREKRTSTRSSNATKDQRVKEKPEVKQLPKERVSTIPEISAIADYARLKVIVSEDEANATQEFPPNKKEGFFPLIQTRHSRRPVFTADPQDISVKDERLPSKTEASPKVKKEAKPLVFPITEKEHQRTGMFKLADKEIQEKKPLDAKVNECVVDTGSPTTPHTKQRSEEQESGLDAQRVCHVAQNIHEPNNPPLQATTSTSAVNEQRSTSVLQHAKPLDTSTPRTELVGRGFDVQGGAAKLFEERNTSRLQEEKRAEDTRVKRLLEENRASLAKEERRAAQREEEKRAREREAIAMKIKQRREKQREADRKAGKKHAAQKEEEMRTKQREEERQMKEVEEKRLVMIERKKLREEEERRREDEERRLKQREAAQEEQQKRVDQQEQQKRADQEEQQKREAQEEQQRKADQEEQQKRDAQEEQHKRADQEEQQKRVDQQEQQRRVDQQEQQKRADQEEQQKRDAQEEQQRRADQEEQQKRDAQEEQHKRADQEEQQKRVDQQEQQRRVDQQEQQKRADQEEQQKRGAQEEQQRRADQEEQQRRVDQEEQQKRDAQEEQQRRADQEEQRRRDAQEEQKRRADQQEQQKRADQEELQKRGAQEEQQRRADLIKAQRQAKYIEERILSQIEEKREIKQREEQEIEEQRGQIHKNEELMRSQREEDEKIFKMIKQRQDLQTEEERNRRLEENREALKEEERVAQEWMQAQREDQTKAKNRGGGGGGEEEASANHRDKQRGTRMEEQKRAVQRMDALQYYAITSKQTDRKPRERQLRSPLPSAQRHNLSGLASSEDSGSNAGPYRPHAAPSPAPSLPRSNTSSPSLGAKPLMFRVKDNTIRGSSFTKSVKPRFHKNFGEDLRVGSPMERGSGREEEEQDIRRRSAETPVQQHGLDADKESSALQPAYLSQDYLAALQQRKPYSRRSIVLDEDDSRSVISNMSEGGESFATSAADLVDVRGLCDYERPESACSFSSGASRSLGKPPTVPPKSDKALRRAQRLTTRRIRKESSKNEGHAGVEKSLQEVSSAPSSSVEERFASGQVVASPHFASPVSLAHAPTSGSGFPSLLTEPLSSPSSFYASPHVTGPISLPVASPHAAVSLPDASTGTETIAHVPPSPALYPANHQAPVAQYHVESSYPHSYPLTQRKVLQDLGSGQYFLVDVPVTVKTKTFFDPETGKYVQLNVRQSGQNYARPQRQQTYPQPQLQPQMHVKLQHQPPDRSASKLTGLHSGNHDYPRDYRPPTVTSAPCNSSSPPSTLHRDQGPAVEGHVHGYPARQMGQKCEGHRYSPEKTPYMDTAKDKVQTCNTVYNMHGPNEWCPENDANSQHTGGSGGEDDNSAHSQCVPRDIITISELEDFMEMSDW